MMKTPAHVTDQQLRAIIRTTLVHHGRDRYRRDAEEMVRFYVMLKEPKTKSALIDAIASCVDKELLPIHVRPTLYRRYEGTWA